MGNETMKKTVLDAVNAAKKGFIELANGKSDGSDVDAHIKAAAQALDIARAKLEADRDADAMRTREPGHQTHVKNLVDFLKEQGMEVDPGILAEGIIPIRFDRVAMAQLLAALPYLSYGQDKTKLEALRKAIVDGFSGAEERANAISVLKAHANKLRDLTKTLESEASLDTSTIKNMFSGVLGPLDGWNDDLSVYGDC